VVSGGTPGVVVLLKTIIWPRQTGELDSKEAVGVASAVQSDD
jgi:hypothetical protein